MLPSGCYVIDAKYIVKGSFGMEICVVPVHKSHIEVAMVMNNILVRHIYYFHARTNFMTKRVNSIYA